MQKRSKRLFVLLFSISIVPLAGCWDRTELNDLALITATGIDKNDNNVSLSVQVYIPRAGGGGQNLSGGGGTGGGASGQTFVRTADGLTIADAMSRLQEMLPRRVFWGHNEVFIFGEEVAKEGIQRHIDFMMRYPQVREGAYVFIGKGLAKEYLKSTPPLERNTSEVLREMAKSKMETSVTVKELMQMIVGDSRAAALPWIEFISQEEQNEKKTIPFINGTAVLKKDKLVGHIDDKTTRGLLWMRNKIKTTVVTVQPEDENGYVSMQLLRARSKLIPKIKDGEWSITLKAETEDDIIQNETKLELTNPEFSEMLQDGIAKEIEDRVNSVLGKVQKKMNADIFGFAEAFHRKYPSEWNKVKDHWDEVFPKVDLQVDVTAYVRRPGMESGPAGVPEDEAKKK